jgi:rubrerythrin
VSRDLDQERDRLFRDMQAQRDEALARVEKLTEMLDGLTPCGADCGVMAFGAWVDPSDSKRVHEMRDLLRERVLALTLAIEQALAEVKETREVLEEIASMTTDAAVGKMVKEYLANCAAAGQKK